MKVKDLAILPKKKKVYSIGDDRLITLSDYSPKIKIVFQMKCSNMHPKAMSIDKENLRLFVTMKSSVLFILDLLEIPPVVLKTAIN
jgi:hypothetical protein